jgi:acid phosphatase family membrane protein YuiD
MFKTMIFKNELLVLLATTWMISQTIKYLRKLYNVRVFSLGHLRQTYLYSSGMPSGHAAVLTSAILYMYHKLGPQDPLLYMIIIFGYFWLFEIYMQRRRFDAQIELLDSLNLKSFKHEDLKVYKDLSGHDLIDIAVGILVAIVVYFIFLHYNVI